MVTWQDYDGSVALLVYNKRLDLMAMAVYDSICVYWDIYFPIEERTIKCSTNMDSIMQEDFDLIGIYSDKKFIEIELAEHFKHAKFMFYPDFIRYFEGGLQPWS